MLDLTGRPGGFGPYLPPPQTTPGAEGNNGVHGGLEPSDWSGGPALARCAAPKMSFSCPFLAPLWE